MVHMLHDVMQGCIQQCTSYERPMCAQVLAHTTRIVSQGFGLPCGAALCTQVQEEFALGVPGEVFAARAAEKVQTTSMTMQP